LAAAFEEFFVFWEIGCRERAHFRVFGALGLPFDQSVLGRGGVFNAPAFFGR
jgi:hypothetical protein